MKRWNGRQFVRNAWMLPGSLEEIRAFLSPLCLVDDSELLEAEMKDIQRVQARLLELAPRIEQRTQRLTGEISRYSYRSKSNRKAGYAHNRSLLEHALQEANMPIDRLTEPQIKAMYAALRLLEEE